MTERTSVNTCGTCRFWGSGDRAETERFRECTAIIHDRGYPVSPNTDCDPNFADAHCATAVDGSGYYAAVRCRADFGCVLHQLRGTTP